MPQREGIENLTTFLLVGLLALFGGAARLLYKWPAKSTLGSLGNLMTSVFAAVIVGLLGWEQMGTVHPAIWAGLIGLGAWVGGDLLDRLARRFFSNGTTLN